MKYIKLFLESKNLGNLYHIVDIEKLNYILDNNKIESYKAGDGKISLTRNKMMTGYLGDNSSSVFKLEIDGDKLSHKYRIKPYRYKTRNAGYLDEYEEQVQTNKITNIFNYTNKIIIDKKRVLNLMYIFDNILTDWFTSEGTRHGNFPNVLKRIKEKTNQVGLELYVQDGSIIKKDDKWIDSIINFPIKNIEKRYFIVLRKRIEIGRYRYQDSLVDFDNKIIIKDLVVGYNIEIDPDNINGIELKSFEESKKYNFDDDDDSKHYFLDLRKLDDGNWKIDNIRPIT